LKREIEGYLDSEKKRIGVGFEGKVHLEITAKGHFSEELKEAIAEVDDKALGIIRVERFSPNTMRVHTKNPVF